MTKYLYIFLALTVISGVIFYDFSKTKTDIIVKTAPTPTDRAKSKLKTVRHLEEEYGYDYFRVDDPSNLNLIPNYETKLSSQSLIENNRCLYGINGGFYSEADRAIGEFITDGRVLSKFQENKLFNGQIKIKFDNNPSIGYNLDSDDARILLQTGPMLVSNGKTIDLDLVRDKKARRMVAAIDEQNKLIFITLFNQSSFLDGPKLSEVGELITNLNELNIKTAINMDGGSASAFYSPKFSINEWQNVGSWWCYRQ